MRGFRASGGWALWSAALALAGAVGAGAAPRGPAPRSEAARQGVWRAELQSDPRLPLPGALAATDGGALWLVPLAGRDGPVAVLALVLDRPRAVALRKLEPSGAFPVVVAVDPGPVRHAVGRVDPAWHHLRIPVDRAWRRVLDGGGELSLSVQHGVARYRGSLSGLSEALDRVWRPAHAGQPDPPAGFTCYGDGPFWVLRVEGERGRFAGPGAGPAAGRLRGAPAEAGTPPARVWRGRLEGDEAGEVVAILGPQGCPDPSRAETSPLGGWVSLPGGDLLVGCCRPHRSFEGPWSELSPGRPADRGEAPAGGADSGALAECSSPPEERGSCLESALARAEARLEAAAARVRARMARLDAPSSGEPGAEWAFRGSQEAFLLYREARCRWQAAAKPEAGGRDAYQACRVDMTRARAAELEAGLP
ncbi:MAG: hypothetical protein Kow0092_04660 [Deferrisomatales bacterium]